MTDVYIAYAREDRERVRLIAEMLQFEGWDVWMDPTDPSVARSAAIDLKLGSAGAILVIWSPFARGSEYVRSEAATGLYKNKLIQTRLDSAAPPRPFDQVEVIDVGLWSGERDDPNWRRIMSAIRLYAGLPGSTRPQVTRRATSGPAHYLEPRRSIAWAPIVAAGLLTVAGAGVWLGDPFGWRSTRVASAEEAGAITTAARELEAAELVPSSFEDTEESAEAWRRIDRKDPTGLRDYIIDFPRASGAETAQSLLRVLDAQAWVSAVTADNEAGYQSYLKGFPVDASVPGSMAADARARLVSLSSERTQAIEDIQRGLTALKLYRGDIDGKGGNGTANAVRQFATARKRAYPTLSTAAPRDLRAFADVIARAVSDSGVKIASITTASKPIIATATTSPSSTAAAEADRQRIEKAQQAANKAATQAAATQSAARSADSLALTQQQDAGAWADAEKAGTLAAYQVYLANYPSGLQAGAARSAVMRLSRPAPFSLDQIAPEVRAIADAARRAQVAANNRASAARDAASAATRAPNARSIVAADGDRYETQISNGAPNGLGVRTSGDGSSAGDVYRGELRNGQSAGVGVYEFAGNPNNASSGALRYEGEHVGDAASGYGVTYWKNGDNFAGQEVSSTQSRGVLTFSNGQRYEGEIRNGVRNGIGVVWGADGQVTMAGRWANGELVEAIAGPAAIQLTPTAAAPRTQ